MTPPTLDDLRATWSQGRDEAISEQRRAVLDLLADGQPVSADRIAAVTGSSRHDVVAWLEQARRSGYEVDDKGRLVGAALTLRPTRHQFRVRGNELYAWCGFDTLFLPILLQEAAHVSSTCPVTGATLELDVAPDGAVTGAKPATVVVAIVGPEVTDCCETTGPTSPVCTQMPLLADRAAGEQWLWTTLASHWLPSTTRSTWRGGTRLAADGLASTRRPSPARHLVPATTPRPRGRRCVGRRRGG